MYAFLSPIVPSSQEVPRYMLTKLKSLHNKELALKLHGFGCVHSFFYTSICGKTSLEIG